MSDTEEINVSNIKKLEWVKNYEPSNEIKNIKIPKKFRNVSIVIGTVVVIIILYFVFSGDSIKGTWMHYQNRNLQIFNSDHTYPLTF